MSLIARLALSLIPGGGLAQIVAAIGSGIGAALTVFASFIKWLVADITDALKEPQRLAVRVVCLVAVLIGGLWGGIVHKARKDAAVIQQVVKERDEARAELEQWRDRHAKQEQRAEAAEKARREAEAKIPAAAPPAATPGPAYRMRPRPAAAASQGFGSGLFKGLFANP